MNTSANKPASQPRAGVFYRGPSLIDGSPIVGIAVFPAGKANAKTGAMLQTYILRDDMSPMKAIQSGATGRKGSPAIVAHGSLAGKFEGNRSARIIPIHAA